MLSTLAYGEFQSFDLLDMFLSTLPHTLRLLAVALLIYIPSSAIVQFARWRWLGVVAYVAGVAFIAPTLGVLGAYGPAHVAMDCGLPAFPILGGVLLVKMALLYLRGGAQTQADQNRPSPIETSPTTT